MLFKAKLVDAAKAAEFTAVPDTWDGAVDPKTPSVDTVYNLPETKTWSLTKAETKAVHSVPNVTVGLLV